MILLFVGAGGALGALSRLLVSVFFNARWGKQYPYATLTVNIVGSFFLGFLLAQNPSSAKTLFLGVGFLGGFTTFSTCHYEGASMAKGKEYKKLIVYFLLTYLGALGAAFLGTRIGA